VKKKVDALTALIPLLSGALARAMNAPAEAFAETKRYIAICGGGSVMIVAYNVLGSVMRGMGDSRTPLATVAIASACNISGDLLLIKELGMGAAGAAIATVASQTVSVLVSFFLLKRRTLPFELTRRELCLDGGIAHRITLFGAPISLQSLLVGLSFLVILAITNCLGLIASAGVGVAEKVCAFIMLVPEAFMQSMSAYVAQNTGARQPERALRGLRIAIGLSTAFVMAQGIGAAFLIRIPVAYLMSVKTGRLFYIGLSVPCSTIAQITVCFLFLAHVKKARLDGGQDGRRHLSAKWFFWHSIRPSARILPSSLLSAVRSRLR